MKKGQQTKLTKITLFLEQHEGTMTARYYNSNWHVVIMWDDGERGQWVEGENFFLKNAVSFAWKKAQEAIANRS